MVVEALVDKVETMFRQRLGSSKGLTGTLVRGLLIKVQSVKGLLENGFGLVVWLRNRRERLFWAEFQRFVEVDDVTGCWNWRGRYSAKGYGVFRHRLAFKVAWFAAGREKEFGLCLHHTCFNKRCVNADHLVEIPTAEHIRIHGERWRAERRCRSLSVVGT